MRAAARESRRERRQQFPENLRLSLLEDDADESERTHVELRESIAAIKGDTLSEVRGLRAILFTFLLVASGSVLAFAFNLITGALK